MKKRTKTICVAAFIGMSLSGLSALAVAQERTTERSSAKATYCPKVIRHYETPPRGFLESSPVPPSGRLPFGPRNIRIYSIAEQRTAARFVLEGGQFGYGLWIPSGEIENVPWTVTAKLFSTDAQGRPVKLVASNSKRAGALGDGHQRQIMIQVPRVSGFYRYRLSFEDGRRNQIAQFSEYVRVMSATTTVRIGVEHHEYRPGGVLLARVENIGTEGVQFGAQFAIEQFKDAQWVPVGPERKVWPRYLVGLAGGTAGGCMRFVIPVDFAPGEYRLSKSIQTGANGEMGELVKYGFFSVGFADRAKKLWRHHLSDAPTANQRKARLRQPE